MLVRVYIKKQAWYKRYELISYVPNEKIFDECIDELVISGLILKASTESFSLDAILNELSIDELKEVIKKTLSKKARMLRTKQALINSILKAAESAPIYSMFDTTKENSLGPLEQKVFNSCLKLVGGLFSINFEAWKFFNLVNRVFTHYNERYGRNAIMKGFKSKVKNDNYISYNLTRSGEIFPTSESLVKFNKAMWLINDLSKDFDSHSFTSAKLKEVLEKIEPAIEIWRQVIDLDYSSYKSNYFLRFTPAFACTKLINDYYLPCLVKLKLVQEEANILGELLGQSLFLQNQRAKWWNRLSYIQGSILSKEDSKNSMKAYGNCGSALQEALSNGIYSESAAELYERMVILEKKLNIKKKESRSFRDLRPFMPPVARIAGISSTLRSDSETERPLWIIEATGENVSTEDFVLNYFAMEDWDGCYSKNTILTTLFALLFIDILFLPLPGVFETPYQTHPLDLGTEAFYLDRLALIEARLNEISIGNFMELLKTNYEAHIESRVNIIGLDWSHSFNDLMEISYCIGASPLSKIFKLFCLEYFTYTAILPELW
jgi:Fanconi-associated nuclease 1